MVKIGEQEKTKIATIEELRAFLSRYFAETGKRVRVVLYGSRARGTHQPHSDVDLAIIGEADMATVAKLQEILEHSRLPHKVDIALFAHLPGSVQEEVLKEGQTWIDFTKP